MYIITTCCNYVIKITCKQKDFDKLFKRTLISCLQTMK